MKKLHFTSVRLRPYEHATVEAARAASGESQSDFLRRAAMLLARATLVDAAWDTAQQRRDNAVIGAIHEGLGSGEDDA